MIEKKTKFFFNLKLVSPNVVILFKTYSQLPKNKNQKKKNNKTTKKKQQTIVCYKTRIFKFEGNINILTQFLLKER